ncbi:hypothetical protein ACFOY8_15060 [Thalassospira xianhensis]|uniref:Uncharacterized protein n=1 Tax=Thalassospira xianhensis MCCC 1A02616 TaxID=1177929 RepID=A0A367UGV2_9PROT|nr:hypothetical protein [Thalassospira xianhensis]RCK07536.1 hypothetical protein TH5_00165 [Thalassospira xianhensis MCCC 1A02616]
MSDDTLIHGFTRLVIDSQSPLGVSFRDEDGGDQPIASASELPLFVLELHVFQNEQHATGFAMALEYLNANEMVAIASQSAPLILIGRLGDQRAAATELNDAITLIPHVSEEKIEEIRRLVQDNIAVRREVAKRRLAQQDVAEKWRHVLSEIAAFNKLGGGFGSMRAIETVRSGEHAPEKLRLYGSFLTAKQRNEAKEHMRSKTFELDVERCENGKIIIRPHSVLPASSDQFSAYSEEFSAVYQTHNYQADVTGRPCVICEESRAVEMMNRFPWLYEDMRKLAHRLNALEYAKNIIENREYRRIINHLMTNGVIRQPYPGSPATLHIPGGRSLKLTNTIVGRLRALKLVRMVNEDESAPEWGISEAGTLMLAKDTEKLASILKP